MAGTAGTDVVDPGPTAPRPAVARRVLPVPAERAWELLTDVRRHADWIPLTRIDAATVLGVGDAFTAVSGPGATRGRPGIADRMRVERLEPPLTRWTEPGVGGVAVYRKLGPLLLGTAELHVRPLGPTHSEVSWVERVHLRGLPPALTAPLLRPVLLAMGLLVLRRVAAEVARDAAGGTRQRARNDQPSSA